MHTGVSEPPGSPDALSALLGFELLEREPGRAVLRAVVGPQHVNIHGTAHGGFVFALADTAFAIAGNTHGPVAVATAATIHFVRPVRPGDTLVAEAREVGLGRSTGTYEVTVTREGEVVALFTGAAFRRSP